MIDRRTFIAGMAGGLLVPLAAAQQRAGTRPPTVGVLTGGTSSKAANDAFERGLSDLGWTPGQTIRIEYRY